MKIKTILLSSAFITALHFTALAETKVTLSGVHLCCNSCVKGVEKAVSKVAGATTVIDKDAGVVAIAAADGQTVQKAIDAMVAGGYFGKSSDTTIKAKSSATTASGKTQSMTVEGVHLCCGKCVKAVNDAIGKVKGVKGTTAEKNAHSFQVTGDFSAKDVLAALEKAGLAGRAAK